METLPQVADDLFELVIDIDPARTTWERISDTAHSRAAQLAREAELLAGQISKAEIEASLKRRLEATLSSASSRLHELSESLSQRTNEGGWREHYTSLAKNYDELVRAATAARISELGRFRRLAPANHSRSFFHVLSGVIGAGCYHWLLDRSGALMVMAMFVASFSALELIRKYSTRANDLMMLVFRRIARAREYYQVNSSTYYVWGMLLAVIFFSREAVEAGCIVLAFGDPAASYMGRRFGRTKLFRDKSLVGTLVFFGVAFLAMVGFQLIAYPGAPLARLFAISAVAAVAGAAAELFSVRLDDNFTVPVATALAVFLVF